MTDKLDLIIDKIKDLKEAHNCRLDSIDKNLLEHMKRTEMLENRVDKLEEPGKARKYLKKILIGVGALAGLIYTILRITNIWSI